jgi:hypothetical protein
MKPRHAAALALVGWYLMVPKFITEPASHRLVGPMKRLTFDSYLQCREYRQGLIDALLRMGFSPTVPAVSECNQYEDRLASFDS